MSETVGQKVRSNARSGIITWAWAQVIMTGRIMVYYHFLNAEGYGLWNLSFSILNFFFFYSFGINNAFIKYTAELSAKKEYERLSALLSTGMAASLAMGGAIIGVLYFFSDAVMDWFNFSADNTADAHFVLYGIGIVTAFTLGLGVYKAVLTGIQRLQVINAAAIIFLNIEVGLSFLLLYYGYGIRALVFVYGLSGIGSLLVMGLFVRRYAPEIKINPFRARFSSVPDIFSLGMKMQALGAVSLFAATIDRVVFAAYNGLAFAGLYAMARIAAERAQGAAHQAFGALAPASADLFARGEHAKLSHVYALTLRMCFLGCLYVFSFMAIVPDYTMLFLEGDGYHADSALALRYLCIALTFHTLTGPGSSMMRGAGMVFREMIYHVITLVLFIAFFQAARKAGLPDAWQVQTYSAALAIGSFTFVIIANRYFKAPWHTPFLALAPLTIAAPALAWLIVQAFGALGLREAIPFTRAGAVLALGLLGTSYTVCFMAAAWFLPGLPVDEKRQVLKLVPGGRRIAARYLPEEG